MALTDDIGALIASAQNLTTSFATRAAAIDAAVAAAVAAVPNMERTYWVSPVGNNANAGDQAAPLATIAEAVSRTPSGGMVTINLMADHVMATDVFCTNKVVRVQSDTAGVMRSLTHVAFIRDVAGVNHIGVNGFRMSNSHLSFSGIREIVPSTNAQLNGLPVETRSFAIALSSTHQTSVNLAWMNCEIVIPADRVTPLIRHQSFPLNLALTAVIAPTPLAGNLLEGIAANTAVTSLSWLRSKTATV